MKSLTGTVCAAALAFTLIACGPSIEARMDRAEQAFADNRFTEARLDLASVLQVDESNAAALELLARTNLELGQGAEALSLLERLKATNRLPPNFHILLAEAQLQAGLTDDLLKTLEGHEDADSWRLRALAASVEGDHDAVIRAFDNGRLAPGNKHKLYVALASYHIAREENDAAQGAVAEARRLAPDAIDTRFVSARLAELEDRPDDALDDWEAILSAAPEDRPALLGAIAGYGQMQRIDDLRPLVERGRRVYPDDIEFLYLEARLLANDDDWNGVRELLQESETRIADHPNASGLYGQALFQLGQVEQARSYLARLHRRYPDSMEFAASYAQLLLETGEAAKAGSVIAPFVTDEAPVEVREIARRAARG